MTRADRAAPIAALAPPQQEEIMLAFLLPLEGQGGRKRRSPTSGSSRHPIELIPNGGTIMAVKLSFVTWTGLAVAAAGLALFAPVSPARADAGQEVATAAEHAG